MNYLEAIEENEKNKKKLEEENKQLKEENENLKKEIKDCIELLKIQEFFIKEYLK